MTKQFGELIFNQMTNEEKNKTLATYQDEGNFAYIVKLNNQYLVEYLKDAGCKLSYDTFRELYNQLSNYHLDRICQRTFRHKHYPSMTKEEYNAMYPTDF